MSVTSGFFNSLNHDRLYNADHMSKLFDGMILDGIYDSIGNRFNVEVSSGMTVQVGTGRAWFNGTWIYNDSTLPITLDAPEVLTNRWDAIVLDIDGSPSVRDNSIKIIKGTPSSTIDFNTYVSGTLPDSITLISEENHHQYPLCVIERPANKSEINASWIHSLIGTDLTPFATGLLEHASLDELLGAWRANLDEFTAKERADFTSWMTDTVSNFNTWETTVKTNFENWQDGAVDAFNIWFNNVKGQLTSDVAGQLQNEIDHDRTMEILKNGIVNATKRFNADFTVITQTNSSNQEWRKEFQNNFTRIVTTYKQSGILIATWVKEFNEAGDVITDAVTFA